MTFEELKVKYDILLEEVKQLKAENAELKAKLGIKESPKPQSFSLDEKVALFRSLFIGRDDVYARRWESAASGKSGYQPVCGNEWVRGLCDKKQYKCAVCPNRKLLPLDDKAIYDHLSGKDELCRDVVGLFPILQDDTCRFLAIDFDGTGYEHDALSFMRVCQENNVPAYIERSRSGNGAHVWIFFSESIKAAAARKMGSGLLTLAMNENAHISMKSYDRMFPNQDTLPSGGFGNLIALPLQGKARRNGNSVFMDDTFSPYRDQWGFLSQVQKMSSQAVDEVIAAVCKNGPLGELAYNDETQKPWESKKKIKLTSEDFPKNVKIVCANMIYIEKAGFSSRAINKIRRLAAFSNPDFYKPQAMRLPVYNKPRIIYTATEDESYIGLPRACLEKLTALFDEAYVKYSVEHKECNGIPIEADFSGELRKEQLDVAQSLLSNNNGVLSAATGFGKTVVGAYLISRRKVNTLILVHTTALLNQWKNALESFLQIKTELPHKKYARKNRSPIGTIGAGADKATGIVDIAVMQSLINGDEVKELVKNYGMVIVDECHHVPAVSFEKILSACNARYVYGLSATPVRQDGHHPIIFMQCGPVRYCIDAKTQAQTHSFTHAVVPRFTSFRCLDSKNKNIAQIYSELATNELRNKQICDDAIAAVGDSRTPLILTERTEHVERLSALLSDKGIKTLCLFGKLSAKEKRETTAELAATPADTPLIIIAGGRFIGEGFDFPRLDTLLLAMPIAWSGKVTQYAGRLHREYAGKENVLIYDYVDINVPVLDRMFKKRLSSYKAIGYSVSAGEKAEPAKIIFDGTDFFEPYTKDLKAAGHEVVIAALFIKKSCLRRVKELLRTLIADGVTVKVIANAPESVSEKARERYSENIETLKNIGVKIEHTRNFNSTFTVIDNKTLWYGNLNIFDIKADDNIIRIENSSIAQQVLDNFTFSLKYSKISAKM